MQPSRLCLKNNIVDMDGNEFCGNDIVLSDNTTAVDDKCFSYLINDMNCTSSDFSVFENTENKSASDFLYYDWPEIGNFEDVDKMFRSSDSIFGLGVNKEDDLGWLSSADDLGLGGSGDVLRSDVLCPEFNVAETVFGDHVSIRGCSINDSTCTAQIRSKDSSWTSKTTDSYGGFTTEPAIIDSKNGFIPLEQINEHKQHMKLQSQSSGEGKGYNFQNGSLSCSKELRDEVMHPPGLGYHQAFPYVDTQRLSQCPKLYSYPQNPISNLDSDSSHLSDLASVYLKPCAAESSLLPRGSFQTSSQLQYMESSTDNPPFEVSALAGPRLREKLHSCRGSQSSVNSSVNNGGVPMFDPGSVRKHGNSCDPEGVCSATPAELNVQESLAMSLGLDDPSPEAASFHQLQLVMEQLDLQTKLCIRDGLYRLARNANKRHNHANRSIRCRDAREPTDCTVPMSEETKSFTDMETGTNPIDRSIAHLLFHQCSDSSHDSFPTVVCSE